VQPEEQLTLKLLKSVEERSDLSQRRLASELGIALGLVNAYINRCTRKGLIRIRGKSPRRYLYFLTPKGFAEKARLSTHYLARSLEFYRLSSEEFRSLFRRFDHNKRTRIALYGISDLAEIVILVAGTEEHIEITAIYDQESDQSTFHQVPVLSDFSDHPKSDLIMVTDLEDPGKKYKELVEQADVDKVYLPKIFGIES
jgi:DNA-binding MarR family transcriptional regulator|tara:strand:+ start:242 stop:838 length:597 start_codon:yes stop_codon:yes gene_type:complete